MVRQERCIIIDNTEIYYQIFPSPILGLVEFLLLELDVPISHKVEHECIMPVLDGV